MLDLETLTDDDTLAAFLFDNIHAPSAAMSMVREALDDIPESVPMSEAVCGSVSVVVGLNYLTVGLNDTPDSDHGSKAYLFALAQENLRHAVEHGNALAVSLTHGESMSLPSDIFSRAIDWVMSRVAVWVPEPADIFKV